MTAAALATRARGGFCLAITGTVLLMAAASAPSPFYPQLTQRLQLAPVATTLIFAIYALPLLIALLTLGSLSDRIGRRRVLCPERQSLRPHPPAQTLRGGTRPPFWLIVLSPVVYILEPGRDISGTFFQPIF